MKLTECQISNLPSLARQPINNSACWLFGRRNEHITSTVAHRLAHLISRLETRPDYKTAIGIKWYLANLPRLHSENVLLNVLQPFIDRASEDLDNYEEQFGLVDENYLTTLIVLAGYVPEHILFSAAIDFVTGPCFGSPVRELSRFISYHMWKQGLWD